MRVTLIQPAHPGTFLGANFDLGPLAAGLELKYVRTEAAKAPRDFPLSKFQLEGLALMLFVSVSF